MTEEIRQGLEVWLLNQSAGTLGLEGGGLHF